MSATGSTDEHRIIISLSPEDALASLAEAAGEWGAMWSPERQGGRLTLPVVHGLRRGTIEGVVEITPAKEGAEITLRTESQETTLNRAAVAVLSVGAVSGLVLAAWPFFPTLLRLAPIAFVLAFVAWVLVVSRLRQSGASEFLDSLATRIESPPD